MILKEESIAELLEHVRRVVALYFKTYTSNTIMEYDVFVRFCRDFAIFPDLCNKATLHDIFYALAFMNTHMGDVTGISLSSS